MLDQESSPEWFLHRMDAKAGLGLYVSTTTGRLRNSAFIDGRERFWDSEEVRPLNLGSDARADPVLPPPCLIFHVSFCGSTLLGQLLDQRGRSLVLREPQALVDLATQQSSLGEIAPSALNALSDLAIREMGNLLTAGEALVIKPSNWANSLVPVMCDVRLGAKAVFLSMEPADFVTAVFRGGRDRMAYTVRAAAHLTNTTGFGRAAMKNVLVWSDDPLDQIACFAALSLRVQEHIFKLAMSQRDWGDDHWFDLAQIVADPITIAKKVAKVFGLTNDEEAIERQASLFRNVHSKDQAMLYSTEQRTRENETIKLHHEGRIQNALKWAASLDL